MNLDATLLDKIDDYLSGKLPPEEAAALEQQAANDAETAEAIEFVRLEREGMELILEERLRERMGAWEQELPAEKTRGLSRYGWFLGAALMLLTAFALGWWAAGQSRKMPREVSPNEHRQDSLIAAQRNSLIAAALMEERAAKAREDSIRQQVPKTTPPENRYLALAQEAYKVPDLSGIRKGGGDVSSPLSLTQRAAAFFIEKKYVLAAQTLDSIPAPQRTDALKIRAHAFFNLKKYDLAATDFQALAADGGRYSGDADWHLLLCHLARLPQEQAEFDALLRKMLDPANKHPWREKAAMLKAAMLTGK